MGPPGKAGPDSQNALDAADHAWADAFVLCVLRDDDEARLVRALNVPDDVCSGFKSYLIAESCHPTSAIDKAGNQIAQCGRLFERRGHEPYAASLSCQRKAGTNAGAEADISAKCSCVVIASSTRASSNISQNSRGA